MLHIKFCGNRSTCSGEDFLRVLTIYGRGSQLSHVTQMPRTNFVPSNHRGCTQNLALIGQNAFVNRIDKYVPRVTVWHHSAEPRDAKQ